MKNNTRLHWADALRGIFILMMVVYHFVFDLHYFGVISQNVSEGAWTIFSHLIQFGFFGLVGFSLHLSYRRSGYRPFLKRQFKRAGLVLLVALAISLATTFALPGGAIWFGALHFIAVAIALGAVLIPYPMILALSVIPIYLLGEWFADLSVSHLWLLPLGIVPVNYGSLDYFPLFPWLSLVFLGILVAHWMEKRSLLRNPQKLPRIHSLEFLGRHSLLIYVLHQPILFGGLWLIFLLR